MPWWAYIPWVVLGSIALYVVAALLLTRPSNGPKLRVYDKVDRYIHLLDGRDEQQAFVPFGMLLGWFVDTDMVSDDFRSAAGKRLERLRRRSLTGPKLYEWADGVLTDEMLGEVGNKFARHYVGRGGARYLQDFRRALSIGEQSEFDVEDSWENYDKLKAIIDATFALWNSGRSLM
jgi:hypothetical protein